MCELESLGANLESKFPQIVVFGPKGWLGRSTIDVLRSSGVKVSKILLIGSKSEKWNYEGIGYQIWDSISALDHIAQGALFINLAFLRREKASSGSIEKYTEDNLKIMAFTKRVIRERKIGTFINVSSGVASLTYGSNDEEPDVYASLKALDEIWIESACVSNQVTLINCRLFSLSGKHINEFNNLALSAFILGAIENRKIEVKSPKTSRTYVDDFDFMHVLLHLALEQKNISLDSGGFHCTMEELASQVAKATEIGTVDFGEGIGNKYVADAELFNKIAEKFEVKLKTIPEQVFLTLEAIKS